MKFLKHVAECKLKDQIRNTKIVSEISIVNLNIIIMKK